MEVQGGTGDYVGTGWWWMKLMRNEEGDEGEEVSRVIDQLGWGQGLPFVAKKGRIFTDETVRLVAFGDRGPGDTV